MKHRYPKKRAIPRKLLLAALPALLIAFLIGASALLIDSAPPKVPAAPPLPDNIQDSVRANLQATRPDTLADLPVEAAYPAGPLPDTLTFDKLVLEKSTRRLTAYAGKKPARVYLVALGENPVGHKKSADDKRTPEGAYSISGKQTCSAYHKSLHISYPNERDRARAETPGQQIAIHGLAPEYANVGRFHRLTDWTFGSIAVTNEEIEELFRHTPVGTPIDILP